MKGEGNVLTNSKKKDMITVEQLYQGTHEGLDIILMIYPQARAAAENPKLKFKVRRDERTPSAALWRTCVTGRSCGARWGTLRICCDGRLRLSFGGRGRWGAC